jgi:hypothetical protein
LVFAPDAIAFEPAAASSGAEFSRKVRLMTRGLRGVLVMRGLLNPLRYGMYSLDLFSHKVLRRLVAFALVLLLVTNPLLWHQGAVYRCVLLIQIAFYLCGAVGGLLDSRRIGQLKVFTIPYFFTLASTAALVAAVNVLRGRRIDIWQPQRQVLEPISRHPA